MADHMSAYIQLGGQLPSEQTIELARQVSCQGGPAWGEYYADDSAQAESDLRAASSAQRPFVLYDEEAAWGQFDELETLCQELGLAYRRHCCAKYEYDALWQWWQAGMAEPAWCLASQDGAVLVDASEFQARLQAAARQAQKTVSRRAAVEALRGNTVGWLAARTPPEIPPLRIILSTILSTEQSFPRNTD